VRHRVAMAEIFSLFTPVAKGLEALMGDELRSFGAHEVKETRAGVTFKGTLEMAYRVCLWSRVANRVLLPLKTFPAATPEKLYGGVKSIRWSDHFTPAETIAVDFASSHSAITHTLFGALKVKDAIVDQFRSVQGVRPSVDTVRPNIRINVYLHHDEATVSLDLSGESLHRRGYREEGVAAPLKENLGAAILLQAGIEWPAFMDPMCGSGTLPIEAAMIAANIAPGLRRKHYGFLRWQGHVPALWKRLLAEAEEVQVRNSKRLPRIVGYDADFRAVRVALANVERAGLHGKVHIEKREISACQAVAERGVLAVNPPYGERIGAESGIEPLYKELGDMLKQRFQGWEAYIFTGSPEGAGAIGLKPSRRYVMYNGAIECRLLKYELYAGRR
jgi:23S rRNA (guanine2445-N2)-methyltransferase / 23S rRNA (guanine2069-N7)-methyltransferase